MTEPPAELIKSLGSEIMQDLATAIDALVRASCTSAEIGGIPAPAQFESWLNRCVIPSVLVRLQFLEKKNAGTH